MVSSSLKADFECRDKCTQQGRKYKREAVVESERVNLTDNRSLEPVVLRSEG